MKPLKKFLDFGCFSSPNTINESAQADTHIHITVSIPLLISLPFCMHFYYKQIGITLSPDVNYFKMLDVLFAFNQVKKASCLWRCLINLSINCYLLIREDVS